MTANPKTKLFWSIFLGGVILDQATKWWVYTNLEFRLDEIKVIDGFFSIVHAQNPGAAFGMFAETHNRHWLFIGFTIIAIGIVVDLWRRLEPDERWLSSTLGLILSGAVGNGIDRVHKQTVTDFLMVYTETPWLHDSIAWATSWLSFTGFRLCHATRCEWPSFNVADSALVVGVGMFFIHYLLWDEGQGTSGDDEEPGNDSAPPVDPFGSDSD